MATPSTTRIAQLASSIQQNTNVVDTYFTQHQLATPSFDDDFPTDLPPEIEIARNAVLEATDEMHDLMLGPQQLAEQMPIRYTSILGAQAIHRYKVAEKIGDDEEVAYDEVAVRCQVPCDDLRRLLRQAISGHVFKEIRPGFVAHNAASRYIRDNKGLSDQALVGYDYMWPAATRVLDAMDKWPGTGEPNHSGFNLANNTTDSFFDALSQNARLEEAFANNMKYLQSRRGFVNTESHLAEKFPWATVQSVVDVGGGTGSTAIMIARKHKNVKCIVQDLPTVAAQGESQRPSDVADQVEFMAHNFFDEQPVKTADVYLLRTCLHDWSDAKASLILQRLVPAMRQGVHIVLQEFVLPPVGVLPFYHEKTIRCLDLAMKASFNSKERSLEEWQHLFAQVDKRFKLVDFDMPPGQNLAMIHFSWDSSTV